MTVSDWVSAGRTGSIYKRRFSGLGQEEQIPTYEELASAVETQFSDLTTEEKISLFKKYLGFAEDEFNFVFEAGVPTGVQFSTRGLDRIVDIRDKATKAFWSQNILVSLWQRRAEDGRVPQSKLDHEMNVLKALQSLAWVTQEIADQAKLNPSTRPVSRPSFSGLGVGPVGLVVGWFLALWWVWKIVVVVGAFLFVVGTAYSIVAILASMGGKGVDKLSQAPGKMVDSLNQRPSVECDQADALIASYMQQGVANLSDKEKADLAWLLDYKEKFCHIPFYRSAFGLVAIISGLYIFGKYVWPYVRPPSSKERLLRSLAEKDEPAIPAPAAGKAPKAGDKPTVWERAKRFARGVQTEVEMQYAKRRAFIDCVEYADAVKKWNRKGRPPDEWKSAFNDCRSEKEVSIPKAAGTLSKEFLTYMEQTGLKPRQAKAKKGGGGYKYGGLVHVGP